MKNSKLEETFLPVDKQTNGFNCGLFALGYTSILLYGQSSINAGFAVNKMRNHFMKCLKDAHLYYFPLLKKAIDVFMY